MGGLPQALKIIFEVQRKKNNEKITRKKKVFSTYKMHFFFPGFFSLNPSHFQTSNNFLISYSF